MNEEIWKDIPDYEGLYQISNLGRVKSLEKTMWNNHKNIKKEEMILKPNKVGKGYYCVKLYKNKEYKMKKVHRLVAQAFIDNPENKKQVNHIDGDKENNCVNNLEWCTCRENIKHSWKNNLHKSLKGKYNKLSKEILQYDLQGNFIKKWESITSAQQDLKISNISSVCSGERKKAGGYIWRYKND